MRLPTLSALAALCATFCLLPNLPAAEDTAADEKMLRAIYTAALTTSPAYDHLTELTAKFPGRLSGSKNLEGAVLWAKATLEQTGVDRLELQPVMVPHWERGPREFVRLIPSTGLGGKAEVLTSVAL